MLLFIINYILLYTISLIFDSELIALASPLNSETSLLHADREGLKIAVISAQGPGSTPISDNSSIPLFMNTDYSNLFVQNKRDWTAYHHYDYIHSVIEPATDTAGTMAPARRADNWIKIDLFQKYLRDYDWICWIDLDSLVIDGTLRLDEYIASAVNARPNVDMVVEGVTDATQQHVSVVHSGIMLLRNSFWTRRLLARLKQTLATKIVEGDNRQQGPILLDDSILELLNNDESKSFSDHVVFLSLQQRWDDAFLYLPKVSILYFDGCVTDNNSCLEILEKAVSHLLTKESMNLYYLAPYVQHIYNIFVTIYVIFALDRMCHVVGLYMSRQRPPNKKGKLPNSQNDFPYVVIQLPMFNEISCAKTIIDCCCNQTWPRSRLLIQVVDDSTSSQARFLIDNCIKQWQDSGVDIRLCRRETRYGFKAGAMNEAMNALPRAAEYIVIFDADFEPSENFLCSTVPFLISNPNVAFVQTQWVYTNAKESFLTRMQEISLNYHFKCEQEVRYRFGAFFNFNGTAGVWRRSAIDSVGGWHVDTLVEDMDLSMRVWAAGWEFMYLRDVQVLNEIPPTFSAYRGQQHRWTSGPMQVLKKAVKTITFSRHLSIPGKLFCFWFLLRNYVHLVNFLYFLILIPLMIWVPHVALYEWAVIWLPMAISVSNIMFTPSEWPRAFIYILFENAMCLYKTGALISGILNVGLAKHWIVTPKFARRLNVPDNFPKDGEIHKSKASKKSSLKRFKLYKAEMSMGVFLLACSYYAFLMKQYGVAFFSLCNGIAYFTFGFGAIGRYH